MQFVLRLLVVAGFSTFGFSCTVNGADPKIPVRPAMVLNESGMQEIGAPDGPGNLLDEQDKAGDPVAGAGGTPATFWFPGWTKWVYPAHALIDLGRICHISNIAVYDGQGAGSFTVTAGEPFQWTDLFTDPLTNYLKWNQHPVDVNTRYLRVTLGDAGTRVPEIVLYGTAQPEAISLARPALGRLRHPPMGQVIGTNAFIDDPIERIAAGGFEREYHSWDWDEGDRKEYPGYPDNRNAWNPSAAGGGGWNFDDYYTKLKAAGITVCPCIQGNAFWMTGRDPKKFGTKPVAPGADTAAPASYAAHADHMFQYAARYGGTKVPDALLKLAPGQPRVSGLGLLRYYEDWNEQDKWWEGPDSFFSPYEYAAMASADCDGHQGALGKTFGVKNADPNAKLVMGGIAKLSLDYIKVMKLWADHYRHGSFPCDAINLHHYSNDGGEQQRGKVGISPEADHLKEKVQQFVSYCQENLPGVQVWVTEFGYDTNQASPQHAPPIGPYSAEEVQAQWLVRSYLALAAAGLDRAAMYMLRDVNPQDATQFSSSGLVTEKGKWQPKPAWYYVAAMKRRLSDFNYSNDEKSNDPRVRVYRFWAPGRGAGPNRAACAVWCPTSDGSTVDNYQLALGSTGNEATLVTLANGNAAGVETKLPIRADKVTLNVSERPIFVFFNDARSF